MTISVQTTKQIIRKLLQGDDYRLDILSIINADFMHFAIGFFKQIVDAKLHNQNINVDWYKAKFLDSNLTSQDIAIHSGLNKKTIHNVFGSSKKEIVINASHTHYDYLRDIIDDLIAYEDGIDLTLKIALHSVSVDLNITESLLVINTLAVKRAEIRGGLWSTLGKQVEKPLMHALCMVHCVSAEYYAFDIKTNAKTTSQSFVRETDFYLLNGEAYYKCEVKLMGKGNPESADAVIARGSSVFVADTLSETNKRQLDSLGVLWVELKSTNRLAQFAQILQNFSIPYQPCVALEKDKIDALLERISFKYQR